VVPPERSFLAVRLVGRRPPARRAAGPSAASSGTSVTAASALAESAGSARDWCGTRAPRPVPAGCLRAAELAALATAVTPSFAGRKAAAPWSVPIRPGRHATPTPSCDLWPQASPLLKRRAASPGAANTSPANAGSANASAANTGSANASAANTGAANTVAAHNVPGSRGPASHRRQSPRSAVPGSGRSAPAPHLRRS
jgi:hypothetical protein